MTKTRREEINARLHELAKRPGGLTAEAVVEDARDPDSPLHSSFEWDVGAAARQQWLATASRLINGYRVTVTVESRTLSAPVFVRSPEEPRRFIAADRAASERDVAMAVLQREVARVRAAVGRMEAVAASLGLSSDVAELSARVNEVASAIGAAT